MVTIGTMANRILFVSLLLVIPLLGYFAATALQARTEAEFHSVILEEYPMATKAEIAKLTIAKVCGKPSLLTKGLCQKHSQLNLIRRGAILAGMGGLAMMFCIRLAGWLARKHTALLARLFRPGLYLSVTVLVLLIALHVAIVLAVTYHAQTSLPEIMLAGIAMVAAGVLLFIARTSLGMIKKAQVKVTGEPLSREKAAEFWTLVVETARRVNVAPPQQIIVGLDPGCFVIDDGVISQDGRLVGRTLYCSLPLCRMLTVAELLAVIGHELRHFKGVDKQISQHVYPLYRGTATSLASYQAASRDTLRSIVNWPTVVLLSFCRDSFELAIQRHNRRREYAADRVGARVTNGKTLATALVKLHTLSARWVSLQKDARSLLHQGRLPANLSQWVADSAVQDLDVSSMTALAGVSIDHPTDIHPPLSRRLHYVHEKIDTVVAEAGAVAAVDTAVHLMQDIEQLEEELSAAFQRVLANSKVVVNTNHNAMESLNENGGKARGPLQCP